jgi:hypothetical protein
MKKLMTMLFVAGFASGAFAYMDEKNVEIRQTEPTKVTVRVAEAPQGTVFVKIKDAENQLVLRDRISNAEAFTKRYDLRELPVGQYIIEVSDSKGTLRTATLNTEVKAKSEVFSRITDLGDNQYRLLVANLGAQEITVQIFDGQKLIHTELVENPLGLHKVYTIKGAGFPDSISFKVSTSNGFSTYVASK